MDKSVRDLYALLLKYGGRVIEFHECIEDVYKVVIERDPNLVDIDSSSEYVRMFRNHLYLKNRQ